MECNQRAAARVAEWDLAVVPSDREGIVANANKAAQDLGYASLKPEQLQVVACVLLGRNVFGVRLPTGFGKTLCHAVLPSTFDQVYAGSHPSIVLVVSPLIVADTVCLRVHVITQCAYYYVMSHS